MEREQVIEPLLYIDQPIFEKPTMHMQQEFQTGKTDVSDVASEEQVEELNDIPFKDRSISGQIHYLLHLPKEVPAIRCEIVTEKDKYRGIVKAEEKDYLILKVFGRQDVMIHKEDITSIHLLGF